MDSLTQVALGGAVGYAVLGSKVGRKAILWGAILGTLPDLDVFLPYSGEVESFTYHRGFSHSLLVHLLVSPIIVWLILKVHTHTQQYKKQWFYLVFLCLSTHAILDSFTVYGTQLMWPFTEYPFGFSTLFIIDPVYTLPLLVGLIVALFPKIEHSNAKRFNTAGLVLSSIYIAWSFLAKVIIDQKVEHALAENNIQPVHYLSTPAPLNTLLWRILVMSENQYYEVYASVFDSPSQVSIEPYQSQSNLLNSVEDSWDINRLQWFTKGYYSVSRRDNDIVLTDLRMGAECYYVFNFVVATETQTGLKPDKVTKFSNRPDFSQIGNVLQRIWDPAIKLSPEKINGVCQI